MIFTAASRREVAVSAGSGLRLRGAMTSGTATDLAGPGRHGRRGEASRRPSA